MKHLLTSLFLLTAFMGSAVAAIGPSAESCSYYQELETNSQCGPKGYFQKWAIPMCQTYLNIENDRARHRWANAELMAWLPRVRLCLQESLAQASSALRCQDLMSFAADSHLECYVETGFCELSLMSQFQLSMMSTKALSLDVRFTEQMAVEIARACRINRFK